MKGRIRKSRSVLGYTWVVVVLAVIGTGTGLSVAYWTKLSEGAEYSAQVISALGIVIGGAVAVLLGIWRSIEGAKQVRASERQVAVALQTLHNDRYQRAVELLNSDSLPVRLGGLYALQSLAVLEARDYHVLTMKLLCEFVRDARNRPDHVDGAALSEDAQVAMELMVQTHRQNLCVEGRAHYHLNLRSAYLVAADLSGADFSSASPILDGRWTAFDFAHSAPRTDLSHADMRGAILFDADMVDADLECADLTNANMIGADLSGASLIEADLSKVLMVGTTLTGTKFSSNGTRAAVGLRQSDLDYCRADPTNLPTLAGVRDVDSGCQLVWSPKALGD